MSEKLSLKWGSLKAWDLKSEASTAALHKYFESGKVMASAMAQQDNAEQKQAVCELIDVVDCEKIYLDWDGEYVSKEVAKDYVLNYGKEPAVAADVLASTTENTGKTQ